MKNPLYAFVAFLVVQGLVAAGFISHEQTQEAQAQAEEIVFYLVLLGTSLVGFRKYLETHQYHITKTTEKQTTGPVAETSVKKVDPPLELFTESNGGTPPVSPIDPAEQQIGTDRLPTSSSE